jgi:DNA (cytosine-5)-methyltransferase 1
LKVWLKKVIIFASLQKKMGKKYSEIRKRLQIVVDKKTTNEMAQLTHFFQNHNNGVSQFYEPAAKEYLIDLHENLNIAEEPDFQFYLPIKWDIPFPPIENPKFKFIDLFAGIGGIRLAYQNIGGKCVFTSEWDSFAKKTYEANFGEVPFGDITKISETEIPNHDILLGGFPCQPFSIAGVSKKNALGHQHGFLDKTQGTLFFDIARIIEHKQPKIFMLGDTLESRAFLFNLFFVSQKRISTSIPFTKIAA